MEYPETVPDLMENVVMSWNGCRAMLAAFFVEYSRGNIDDAVGYAQRYLEETGRRRCMEVLSEDWPELKRVCDERKHDGWDDPDLVDALPYSYGKMIDAWHFQEFGSRLFRPVEFPMDERLQRMHERLSEECRRRSRLKHA